MITPVRTICQVAACFIFSAALADTPQTIDYDLAWVMRTFGSGDEAALSSNLRLRVEVYTEIHQLANSDDVEVEKIMRSRGARDGQTPFLVKLAALREQHALTECQARALCSLSSRSAADMPSSIRKELVENSLKILALSEHPLALEPLLFNIDAVRDPPALMLGIGAEPSGVSISYTSVESLMKLFPETAPEAIFHHVLKIAPSKCKASASTGDPKRIELLAYSAIKSELIRQYRRTNGSPEDLDRAKLVREFRQRATKTFGSQDNWSKEAVLFLEFLEAIHPRAYDVDSERPGISKRMGLPQPKKSYLFRIERR